MLSILRPALAIVWLALPFASLPAAACPGERQCPIRVQMARGSDTIVLSGETKPNVDCCAYVFRANAGQTLTWTLEGATLRTIITDPQGETDGPGLPNAIALRYTGDYVFEVRPNLMAEGAFGPFRLNITIR
jgi:hypothetical protein